jgi:hypothetical protein
MIWQVAHRIRTLLHPAVVTAIAIRPSGWFVVDDRDRLVSIVCWAGLSDGRVAALVAGRRGLRMVGRSSRYLCGAPISADDVQASTPPVTFAPVDLVAAVGQARDVTVETQADIYGRLQIAARSEWAQQALVAFTADPERFIVRYWERLAEHGRRADVDPALRTFLNNLTVPDRAKENSTT